MTGMQRRAKPRIDNVRNGGYALVYKQNAWTRATHWLWAVSLFFLMLSGLQIFNAHPALYLGDQSGFHFDNTVLRIDVDRSKPNPAGYLEVFGTRFETTGILGLSGEGRQKRARAFPSWATIPSGQDLATGRVIHFFFAWVFVATLAIWLLASAVNGHLSNDIVPRRSDLLRLGTDLQAHLRIRLHRGHSYAPLQKCTYAAVLLVIFPLMIMSGLAMSPGMNAILPLLPELFGGRQSARTMHFTGLVLLVLFFIIHILMMFAAGPFNELRSIVTGWYRIDQQSTADLEKDIK